MKHSHVAVSFSGWHKNFYQLNWMVLAIFLYISYVYSEIFTRPNGIFTRLGRVDVDFFLPLSFVAPSSSSMTLTLTVGLFCGAWGGGYWSSVR